MTLASIASDDGTFAILAMDQRATLRRMFAAVDHPDSDTDMREFKRDVIAGLGASATGVLTDPDYGVPAMRQFGLLGKTGLLVAADPAQRDVRDGIHWAFHDPALDAAWVGAQGGDALKFLVHLRPLPAGVGDGAVERALAVISDIVTDCRQVGVPSVIENVVYALPGEELTDGARSDLVVEAARMLNELGPDLLKLEYPGSPQACRRLAEVVTAPWVMLSGGVSFEQFKRNIVDACAEGGASGFIAGRSFWKEAVGMSVADRQAFLGSTARARLDECVALIAGKARPWASALA